MKTSRQQNTCPEYGLSHAEGNPLPHWLVLMRIISTVTCGWPSSTVFQYRDYQTTDYNNVTLINKKLCYILSDNFCHMLATIMVGSDSIFLNEPYDNRELINN